MIAYTITIYLWNRNLKELVVLFWAGILSQGGMIITAFFPLRASIIFEYIYYIIAILILGDVYLEKNIKEIVICSVVPFLLFCILNIVRITNGYLENSKINNVNNFYRDKKHLVKIADNYMWEEDFLNKMYKKC